MNRRSVRLAGHHAHADMPRHTEMYEQYVTFREVYDTRHACARRMYTHVHIITRGRRCPADENSTGIARRDVFSEIYAVVAGILHEGNMFHSVGGKKKREKG